MVLLAVSQSVALKSDDCLRSHLQLPRPGTHLVPDFDDARIVDRLHEDLLGTGEARREIQIIGHRQGRSHCRTAGTRSMQSTLAVTHLSAAGEHPCERRARVVQQVKHVGCPIVMNEASIKAAQAGVHDELYEWNGSGSIAVFRHSREYLGDARSGIRR